MQYLKLLSIVLLGSVGIKATETPETKEFNSWTDQEGHQIDWHDMSITQRAFALERYREEIEYSIQNIGKSFSDVTLSKMGSDKGYKEIVPFITHGLIGLKYQDDYNHPIKAAEYYYKGWLEYRKCEEARLKGAHKGSCVSVSWPDGYDPLSSAIHAWESVGMYAKALEHYQELHDDMLFNHFLFYVPGTRAEKLKMLKTELEKDPQIQGFYNLLLHDWENAKNLAKTAKPKPLHPDVQTHDDFYSLDIKKVLGALEYYSKHKVRFMVEKALKDKRPDVVKKAKEYLENWDKPAGQSAERNSVGRQESGLQP